MNTHSRTLAITALTLAFATALGCDGDRNDDTAVAPLAQTTPAPVSTSAQADAGTPIAVVPPPAAAPAPMTIETQYAAMDRNGDGAVTPEEHATEANAMFATMDADGDRNVNAAEMEANEKTLGGSKRVPAADRIKPLDSDGDGMLSLEEQAASARGMFNAMDTDGNGDLSMTEMKAGQQRMTAPPKQ